MNKKLITSLVLGALLSGLTLYLAFRNVPVDRLLHYLSIINYWWIGPTVILVLASFALRVVRWQIILRQAGGVSYWQAFHPLMIGFMMNCVLPGRIGELARPVILKRNENIPIATGLGTVAAERVFDFIMLIGLLVLISGTIAGRPDLTVECFGVHLTSQRLTAAAWMMIGSSIALLIFLALITVPGSRRLFKGMILAIAKPLSAKDHSAGRLVKRFTDFLLKIMDNFAVGLEMVRNPGRLLGCIGLTIVIWGLAVLTYPIFALGCPGITLNITGWTTVMVVICFFIALPSVPGFWGLWEAAGVFALALFGVAEKDALGFTLVNHAAQVFPVIAVGLASAWLTGINIFRLSANDGSPSKDKSDVKGA
jgi:uncharacterized protein (TIRG00374 family)